MDARRDADEQEKYEETLRQFDELIEWAGGVRERYLPDTVAAVGMFQPGPTVAADDDPDETEDDTLDQTVKNDDDRQLRASR